MQAFFNLDLGLQGLPRTASVASRYRASFKLLRLAQAEQLSA